MVDYQYVGRGCGIQDVAYFLSSALSPDDCAVREKEALLIYFTALEAAIMRHQPTLNAAQVVEEWQYLYKWAGQTLYGFWLVGLTSLQNRSL